MNTLRAAAAAVTGARHLRAARNGQDAAAAWQGRDGDGNAAALVIVSDGCSSGTSSEVGAQFGATLFARALAARITAGARVSCAATWTDVRAEVASTIGELVARMRGERSAVICDYFLFTIVAAAATEREAAVWLLGDGVYSFGDYTRVVGPFENNEPPYLAYDLVGDARPAHFQVARPSCAAIVIGTDGAGEIAGGIERFAAPKLVAHPDALRRELALLARAQERIDWAERRVVRTPAVLQDDCAIGVLRWSPR